MTSSDSRDLTKMILLNAAVASVAFTTFHVVASQLPPEAAEDLKSRVMDQWSDTMTEQWNGLLGEYTKALAENPDIGLADPEDLQQEYNEIAKAVQQEVTAALWPEGKQKIA